MKVKRIQMRRKCHQLLLLHSRIALVFGDLEDAFRTNARRLPLLQERLKSIHLRNPTAGTTTLLWNDRNTTETEHLAVWSSPTRNVPECSSLFTPSEMSTSSLSSSFPITSILSTARLSATRQSVDSRHHLRQLFASCIVKISR